MRCDDRVGARSNWPNRAGGRGVYNSFRYLRPLSRKRLSISRYNDVYNTLPRIVWRGERGVMRVRAQGAVGWLDGASDRVFTAGIILAAITSSVLLIAAVFLN